jgi:hypothetical protein
MRSDKRYRDTIEEIKESIIRERKLKIILDED